MHPSPITPTYALEPYQGRWVAMLMEGDLTWEKNLGG